MRITKNRLVVLVGLLLVGGLLLTLTGAFFSPAGQVASNLQPTPIPPTRTPLPTATPKPTDTPIPTNTPVPTNTPEPTATPTPVPTATPTPIPTPTPTPKIAFADRFSFLPTDTVKQLRPGVIQVQRIEPGPIRLNVLLFDLTAPEFDLQVVLPHGTLSDGVERTSTMGKENSALAAVNGDLFSGNGLPQGLTVSNSKLAVSPKHRATFAYSKITGPFIGYFTQTFSWPARVVANNGEQHSLEVLNAVCKVDWMCLYNDLFGDLAAGSNDVRVLVDENYQVTAIKQEAYMKIPEGSQLVVGKGQAGKWLLQNVNIGDTLDLRLTTDPDYRKFSQIVSGGPVFLRDGEFVQDCLCNLEDCGDSPDKGVTCEEFTTEWKYLHYLKVRMPRNAIGYNDDKTVLVSVVVDGYQPGYSIGMTQKEEADLMTEFGATTAMELDGGGSATMWVDGKLASHPSDGNGTVERMVPDAVIFNWNGPAEESDSTDDSTATTTPQATSRYGTPSPTTSYSRHTTPTPSPSPSFNRRGTPTPKPTRPPSNSR